jgi:hypothetical protein
LATFNTTLRLLHKKVFNEVEIFWHLAVKSELSKWLLTKWLLSKWLLSKWLLSKWLLTKWLLSKWLLIKRLLSKWLLTKWLLSKWLLSKLLLLLLFESDCITTESNEGSCEEDLSEFHVLKFGFLFYYFNTILIFLYNQLIKKQIK